MIDLNLETAKKVNTYDLNGKCNGYLIELGKNKRFTTSYLSVALPGCFKGWHLHRQRSSNYVCIKGEVTVITYVGENLKELERLETTLCADFLERLHIPINIPTGLLNESEGEAWLINSPEPPYDPLYKEEQVDLTQEECEAGKHLKKI